MKTEVGEWGGASDVTAIRKKKTEGACGLSTLYIHFQLPISFSEFPSSKSSQPSIKMKPTKNEDANALVCGGHFTFKPQQ